MVSPSSSEMCAEAQNVVPRATSHQWVAMLTEVSQRILVPQLLSRNTVGKSELGDKYSKDQLIGIFLDLKNSTELGKLHAL